MDDAVRHSVPRPERHPPARQEPVSGNDFAVAVAFDAADNIYVVGNRPRDPALSSDVTRGWVQQYTPDGTLAWILPGRHKRQARVECHRDDLLRDSLRSRLDTRQLWRTDQPGDGVMHLQPSSSSRAPEHGGSRGIPAALAHKPSSPRASRAHTWHIPCICRRCMDVTQA